MDLAKLIDDAFANGCTGLTIWTSDKHGYQANVRKRDGKSWTVEHDEKPSVALGSAIQTARLRTTEHLSLSPVRKPSRRDDGDLI